MKFRVRVAAHLRQLAERLDPSALPIKPDGESDVEFALRMANDMTLRNALHRALHRYSPREEPGQA